MTTLDPRPNEIVRTRLARFLHARGPVTLDGYITLIREFDWSADPVRTVVPPPVETLPRDPFGIETLPRGTLRDQFAMHAPLEPLSDGMGENSAGKHMLNHRARMAYAYADAMLAARGAK